MLFSASSLTESPTTQNIEDKPCGRLAPSPTGLLHLGNAWSFLWAWLWAKSSRHTQGCVLLRMEDIDPQRARKEYAATIEDDLRWLGLHWDGPVLYQSQRVEKYHTILHDLQKKDWVYPCYCTRKELRSLAGAPHVEDSGAPYPGLCATLSQAERAMKESAGRKGAWRLRCGASPKDMLHAQQATVEKKVCFHDILYGEQCFSLQDIGGDFALCRSDGVVAYQLAVVVDDAAQGVTQVVRGSDILVSTPRQLYLQEILGLPTPQYAHVPLLLDDEGQRLAKRHSSLSLQALRAAAVPPERIIGLLAHLAGYVKKSALKPIYLKELQEDFTFSHFTHLRHPKESMVLEEHRQFLLNGY